MLSCLFMLCLSVAVYIVCESKLFVSNSNIRDTNRDMVVGRIYLAVFVFISIYGVANIFIAIMDESYSMSIRQVQ